MAIIIFIPIYFDFSYSNRKPSTFFIYVARRYRVEILRIVYCTVEGCRVLNSHHIIHMEDKRLSRCTMFKIQLTVLESHQCKLGVLESHLHYPSLRWIATTQGLYSLQCKRALLKSRTQTTCIYYQFLILNQLPYDKML